MEEWGHLWDVGTPCQRKRPGGDTLLLICQVLEMVVPTWSRVILIMQEEYNAIGEFC